MQLKMYSIRDAKGEIFNPPFYKKTHGEAERDFHQLCQDKDGMVAKYPEDYDLYYVGIYDDQKGVCVPLDTPQHMVKAVTLVKQ